MPHIAEAFLILQIKNMRILSFIISVALLYGCTTSTAGDVKEKEVFANTGSRKVVVELFTSQGCSSCPSADKLVSNLAQADTNLIVLSFHVDYWDRLGWKDVFSNHDYTLRQQQYVQALHAESVYTPQAVVQGQFEMVGSNRTGITNALSKVREQGDDVTLSADASVNNNLVTVHYEVNKLTANEQVVVALVQKHVSTSIARGENSGVTLSGYNVVRALSAMPLTKSSNTTQVALQAGLKSDNASVVVFIQNINSKKIVAATEVKM